MGREMALVKAVALNGAAQRCVSRIQRGFAAPCRAGKTSITYPLWD